MGVDVGVGVGVEVGVGEVAPPELGLGVGDAAGPALPEGVGVGVGVAVGVDVGVRVLEREGLAQMMSASSAAHVSKPLAEALRAPLLSHSGSAVCH